MILASSGLASSQAGAENATSGFTLRTHSFREDPYCRCKLGDAHRSDCHGKIVATSIGQARAAKPVSMDLYDNFLHFLAEAVSATF